MSNVDRAVDAWNEDYPIGQRVRYHSVRDEDYLLEGDGVETRTRSTAWNLCGTPVVKVEGVAGGVSILHLRVLVQGGER